MPPMMPQLKTYYGPCGFAHVFAAAASLRRASLWDTAPLDAPAPDYFADGLSKLHAVAPDLVSLTVDAICPSAAIARAISQFRALEVLHLKIRDGTPRRTQGGGVALSQFMVDVRHFCTALDGQLLPKTLRRVEIRTRVELTCYHSRRDVMKAMQTNLPLPYISKRTMTCGEFTYAYKCHAQDAIVDDNIVDLREEWGFDDSDADSRPAFWIT
jgi:hypothetical protein